MMELRPYIEIFSRRLRDSNSKLLGVSLSAKDLRVVCLASFCINERRLTWAWAWQAWQVKGEIQGGSQLDPNMLMGP